MLGTSQARSLCFARHLVLFAMVACASVAPSSGFAACGDGILESPAEQCDDGNTDAGDCCAADCQYEQEATPCGLDDVCIKAVGATCNGEGDCAPPDTTFFCVGNSVADLFDPGAPEEQSIRMRGRDSEATDNLGDPSAGDRKSVV